MGVLLIIIGIALIILSALLMLAKPIMGGIGIIIGILAIMYGRKNKKQVKTEKHIVEANNSTITEYSVAGYDYYQNELKSLLKEPTYEYSLTGKSFKENVFERVYEYEIEWYEAKLVHEPENEFDTNAIAVYVDDLKIGYIARKDQHAINEEKGEVEIYGGKFKELEIDEYENEKIITGETPYKAKLYIESR